MRHPVEIENIEELRRRERKVTLRTVVGREATLTPGHGRWLLDGGAALPLTPMMFNPF